MLAAGASAWAHSMSRLISRPQLASLEGRELPPVSFTWLNSKQDGGEEPPVHSPGRPYSALNSFRSLAASGSLNASTSAIVWPVPDAAVVVKP